MSRPKTSGGAFSALLIHCLIAASCLLIFLARLPVTSDNASFLTRFFHVGNPASLETPAPRKRTRSFWARAFCNAKIISVSEGGVFMLKFPEHYSDTKKRPEQQEFKNFTQSNTEGVKKKSHATRQSTHTEKTLIKGIVVFQTTLKSCKATSAPQKGPSTVTGQLSQERRHPV